MGGSRRQENSFTTGARQAAYWADEYNSSSVHRFRLGDCILGKMNIRNGKPRRNRQAVPTEVDAWTHGFAMALAEMHRRLSGGADSAGVCEVARNAGVTLASAKAAGCPDFDLKELRRAGVR